MKGASGRFKGKYDLFTIYLVPGATVLLASLDSWTDTNLSVLGNLSGHKLLFAVWGIFTGIYYCIYVRYLFNIGRYRNIAGKSLVYTAAAFLLTAVMIPYTPEQYPLKAHLHVLLAFLSPILLAAGTGQGTGRHGISCGLWLPAPACSFCGQVLSPASWKCSW